MADRTTDGRQRIAYHEAGHCLGAWLWYRDALEVVSIRPGRSHVGIAVGTDRTNLAERIDGRHPLDGLDPVARRDADRRLTGVLLGDAAEALFVPVMGRQADPIGYVASLTRPADLTPAVRARLAAAEADPNGMSDEDRAFGQAFRLVGLTAPLYLAWLAFEARRIAADHAAGISSVANVLLAADVLDGATVIELFDANNPSRS